VIGIAVSGGNVISNLCHENRDIKNSAKRPSFWIPTPPTIIKKILVYTKVIIEYTTLSGEYMKFSLVFIDVSSLF